MRVYLCGPINGCSDGEALQWRSEAEARLSPFYEVLDPMVRDYRGVEVGNEAAIVEGDKADIDASDAVLVNARRPSWGTAMEVLYAHERGKRVVAFVGHERASPWLKYHCQYVSPDMADCIVALTAGLK